MDVVALKNEIIALRETFLKMTSQALGTSLAMRRATVDELRRMYHAGVGESSMEEILACTINQVAALEAALKSVSDEMQAQTRLAQATIEKEHAHGG